MNDARQRCSDQTAQQIDVATKERPLTRFSEMISDMHRIDGAWTTDISEEWLQGRALFGGLTAALCLEAAAREFPDLPPLRSAQFAMVAPSSGDVSIHAQLLRRGKSATFVSTSLFSESGLATRATLCFGAPRSSAFDYVRTTAHTVPPPDQCPLFELRKLGAPRSSWPPTRLAIDILHHHYIGMDVGLAARVEFSGRKLVQHG